MNRNNQRERDRDYDRDHSNNRNENQPPYSQRNEEWYRHTYGLPANGNYGQRRHDVGEWSNSNFAQGASNREYNRINERFDRDENRRDENSRIGEHRGKGPKGYSRTDDRIKDDINDRLTDDAHIDASEIEVSVLKGEVTLTGTVGERSDKRRAEDIAEFVSGVINVENRIRVRSEKSSDRTSASGPGKKDTNGHYSDSKKATAL